MTSPLNTRLSKLDAPDREVDAAVFRYLAGNPTDHWFSFGEDHYTDETVPHITGSTDAAIALAERLSPGTEYEFTNLYNIVRVTIEMNGEYGGFHGEHVNSLPIAICIALLHAKEASNGQ